MLYYEVVFGSHFLMMKNMWIGGVSHLFLTCLIYLRKEFLLRNLLTCLAVSSLNQILIVSVPKEICRIVLLKEAAMARDEQQEDSNAARRCANIRSSIRMI